MNLGSSSLRNLAELRDAESHRVSSFDRTGGNDDRLHVAPGTTAPLESLTRPVISPDVCPNTGMANRAASPQKAHMVLYFHILAPPDRL